MTRSELITELAASNPHLRQGEAELTVATVFDQISSVPRCRRGSRAAALL
jgi:hypothetical protein